MRTSRVFPSVLFFLITAGWAANHFASALVALKERADLDTLLVNSAYGIYAAGLFPCLIAGGFFADRFGGRNIVITGTFISVAGNMLLMLSPTAVGLLSGRLIVGLGVGLVVSAGTAWATRLKGAAGSTLAGIFLTTGFALGPIASGVLAHYAPELWIPYAVSIVLSLSAVVVTMVVGNTAGEDPVATSAAAAPARSTTKALVTSVPVALWVFASITSTVIVLSARIAANFSTGVIIPGVAAGLGFGTALVMQALGRRFAWGPISGAIGALCSATGMIVVALAGPAPTLAVFFSATILLGAAYGLCLRDGLLDVEAYAPINQRGLVLGFYYVATYIGFALPPLIAWLEPRVGLSLPYFVLAALGLTSALVRFGQIRSGYLART